MFAATSTINTKDTPHRSSDGVPDGTPTRRRDGMSLLSSSLTGLIQIGAARPKEILQTLAKGGTFPAKADLIATVRDKMHCVSLPVSMCVAA
jgi:hypothetical protein